MKMCSKCGEVKSTTEFGRHASRRDGLQGRCKPCQSIVDAEYRAANADKLKVYNATYCDANREKLNIRKAACYAANPGKRNAANAAWYAANREKIADARKMARAANPEKGRAYSAKWSAANPEAKRIREHNRRARKRENGGKLSVGLADKLFKLQRGLCACCKQPLGGSYHLDHIAPIQLGGANIDSNIQLLRATCNRQKGATHPIDFMQSRGFLL